MDSTQITHVSLCAGYGGIDLGLKRAIRGVRTIAFSEIEAFACANLVSKMESGLLDPAPIWTDVKTFPWGSFRDKVHILSGGYPCQPFSFAGNRLGSEDPRHLWPFIADGIDRMRPALCFFENVEGHISLGLCDVLQDLGRLGYRATWGIFSASEVGAPHQRKRVFILAYNQAWRELAGSWSDSVLCRKWSEQTGELQVQQTRRENNNQQGDIRHNTDNRSNSPELADSQLSSTARFKHISVKPSPSSETARNQARSCGVNVWPSRPGEQQYGWEPPRVVGDTKSQQDRGIQQPGLQSNGPSAGEQLGDAKELQCNVGNDNRGSNCKSKEWDGSRQLSVQFGNANDDNGECSYRRQTEPPLGRDADGTSDRLYVSSDNQTDELRLLGNGVVPQTAEKAFNVLFNELFKPVKEEAKP